MPELPEVEVTRQGLLPYLVGHTLQHTHITQPQLRWPVPSSLPKLLTGKCLLDITRRGKYLLWHFTHGTLLIHLGMSGKLRLIKTSEPTKKHDHVQWIFSNDYSVCLNDPRRFGCVLWTAENIIQHPLLVSLGPEPLHKVFSASYLLQQSRGKKQAIKPFLMNNKIVVGVGNIYATEALFKAGIHPELPAALLTKNQCKQLVPIVKDILKKSIRHGGTTLRDYLTSSGEPGYFSLELAAYGRAGQPCKKCNTLLLCLQQAQRTTTYCPSCQVYPNLQDRSAM